jgi:hypothetical protein
VKVPVTEENALSTEDIVLQAAEDALLGIDPTDPQLANGLRLANKASTRAAFDAQGDVLETIANETYSSEELAEFNKTFPYTLTVESSRERLLWGWGWCATSQTILNQNFNVIELTFEVEGEAVDPELFYEAQQSGGGLFCRSYYALVYNWPSGDTVLTTTVEFTETVNDGESDYAPGQQVFEYTVSAP